MTTRVHEGSSPEEAQVTAEFIAFLERASLARPRGPGGEVRRFNQGRATGCVDAEFTVPALPDPLRVGLFATPATYRSVIRFANAASASDRERDTRGMAIGVLDAAPANLTPGQTRHDFILNSHPVMPAATAKEFLALLQANEAGGAKRAFYFATHPRATAILLASRQHHACHLDIHYWSTTPYAFGAGRAVKYMARPSLDRGCRRPDQLTDTYLRDALRAHLARGEATFDLMVQFFTDDMRTPLEDATVEWTPDRSPWQVVARIRIPAQPIEEQARATQCEQMAFNPWHALAEHRPLGGMNQARKEIYRAMSEFRRAAR